MVDSVMSDHFHAFSFVDRILSDEVGSRIVGEYEIPASIDSFPLSLVSESIGQCAAMSAMKSVDFQFRPVAGIAGAVDFCGEVKPGQTLRLEADVVKADEEAVGYGGVAKVDGEPIVRLHDCLGPMVGMADFDDPEAVRGRYDLLRSDGAETGAFSGVPEFSFAITSLVEGESAEAEFTIPESADFFGDHFPRNPVFPGTLLMDLNLRLVSVLAETIPEEGNWKATGMSSVKLRAFMPPGEALSLQAKVEEIEGDKATVFVQSRKGKRRNSGARILLTR
jgi:3-hydroxymyristoyl/3-hydroxydecanoyl-(acyl carrier protein) dehydratase